MKKIILVAGGTGNLGKKIINALLERGAEVRAVIRTNTDLEKVNKLEKLGANVFKVNMLNVEEVSKACTGASCVVSAMNGLHDVIIDTQKALLDAALDAGVPRFIPSDYSLDFTKFSYGENRNFDWRKEFHEYLDKTSISATTIFNGAFADLLIGQMPLILFKQKLVLYWGNADHRMCFTTIADTASYTANVALDPSTPRFLIIAGDQLSPREIQKVVTEVRREKFHLFRAGGLGMLSALIKIVRKLAPAEDEIFPAWQGMQYMRNMIDERANLNLVDNERYPNMHWTTVRDVLSMHQVSTDMNSK
jgi:nucleoside-diphosphate-sugar epimerase